MSQILTTTTTSGDEVILVGDEGPYGSPTLPMNVAIEIPAGVTWTGAPDQPMPVIYSKESVAFGALTLKGAGAKLEDVEVEYSGSGFAVFAEGGLIDRVLARSSTSGEGCDLAFGPIVVTNSVCIGREGAYTDVGGGGPDEITLRNDTVQGLTSNGELIINNGLDVQISATNTIVRGATSAKDIEADVVSGSIDYTLDHSNYADISAKGGASVTAAGSATNQTAAPLFVNAAAGDLREAPGSPTIDAGIEAAANGANDLTGNPRNVSSVAACSEPQPGPPDIGAYELVPAALPASACAGPSPAHAPLIRLPVNSITLTKVKLNKRKGTATILAQVSGPGTLVLTGKGIVKSTGISRGVGVVKLAVKGNGKAKKLLIKNGKAQLKATVTFAPGGGGAAVSATKSITLKKRLRKSQ
jgi:hypothetical protein